MCNILFENRNCSTVAKSLVLAFGILASFVFSLSISGQIPSNTDEKTLKSDFRVGEKLTYTISFNKASNAGFAEMFCVSRGKLQGTDSVELRLRMKTIDFVSAAYFNVDESRLVFASTESGLPLFSKSIDSASGFPVQKTRNLFLKPTQNFELLTSIYHLRSTAGVGSFTIQDDVSSYPVDARAAGTAVIKTDIGDFETLISLVESPYFTEKGISGISVNITNDDRRIPVKIRFKTAKGEFEATIASIQTILPDEEEIEATPTPKPTPIPEQTPKPTPIPEQYKDNQPLSPDLPFNLGEKLTFAVSAGGQPFGVVTLHSKERKLISNKDSLVLSANISKTAEIGDALKNTNSITSLNDPLTLTPNRFEIKLDGVFSKFNQTVRFDQNLGTVVFGTSQQEIPIGTYDLLSFAYAIRSFNLKPSRDPLGPVNDTRVAVFIGSQAVVFFLRPQKAETIEFLGRKISAQKVSFSTGNPNIDSLSPQLWLSNDRRRLPLRFSVTVAGKVFVAQLIEVAN